jgi:hypothetical protein
VFVDVGAPLLTRGLVCRLKLLLALARAVILRSEFRETHDHIFLSQIGNSPNLEGQVPEFITPIFTPRHWASISSSPMTHRAMVELFEPAFTRGIYTTYIYVHKHLCSLFLGRNITVFYTHTLTHSHAHTHMYVLQYKRIGLMMLLTSSDWRSLFFSVRPLPFESFLYYFFTDSSTSLSIFPSYRFLVVCTTALLCLVLSTNVLTYPYHTEYLVLISPKTIVPSPCSLVTYSVCYKQGYHFNTLQRYHTYKISKDRLPMNDTFILTTPNLKQYTTWQHTRPNPLYNAKSFPQLTHNFRTAHSIGNRYTKCTYLQTWALLDKPPIVLPLKNFPAIYGTRRYITVLTKALHWSLSWNRSIQSITSHPIFLRFILVLSPQTSCSS